MVILGRFLALCTSCCVLFGCSSIPAEQVNQKINAWKGQSIEDLIKYWGLPSKKHQLDGKNYGEWINQTSEQGNTSISLGSGRSSRHSSVGIGLTLFDLGSTDDACSRLVSYSDDGIVTDISWQGTNNYCFEITPDFQQIQTNKAALESKN